MTFVVLGESLVDVATGRATSQTSTPGGSPMNVAVGLRRLDQDVTLVTHIGADSSSSRNTVCARCPAVAVLPTAFEPSMLIAAAPGISSSSFESMTRLLYCDIARVSIGWRHP